MRCIADTGESGGARSKAGEGYVLLLWRTASPEGPGHGVSFLGGGKQKAFTNFFVKAVSSFLERETGFEPATFSLGS